VTYIAQTNNIDSLVVWLSIGLFYGTNTTHEK